MLQRNIIQILNRSLIENRSRKITVALKVTSKIIAVKGNLTVDQPQSAVIGHQLFTLGTAEHSRNLTRQGLPAQIEGNILVGSDDDGVGEGAVLKDGDIGVAAGGGADRVTDLCESICVVALGGTDGCNGVTAVGIHRVANVPRTCRGSKHTIGIIVAQVRTCREYDGQIFEHCRFCIGGHETDCGGVLTAGAEGHIAVKFAQSVACLG